MSLGSDPLGLLGLRPAPVSAGVWRGKVTRAAGSVVWVVVPRYAPGIELAAAALELGPYAPGDGVAVAWLEGTAHEPIVLGRLATDAGIDRTVVHAVTADRTCATAGGLGSLNTPILVGLNDVRPGQVVDVEASWNGYSNADNLLFWGLRRNGVGMLAKGTWYSAADARRPNTGHFALTDETPGVGAVTYELLVGQTSPGIITLVGISDGLTVMTVAGPSGGGGTQLRCTVRSP